MPKGKTTCPKCEGEGGEEEATKCNQHILWVNWVPCDLCDGSGTCGCRTAAKWRRDNESSDDDSD